MSVTFERIPTDTDTMTLKGVHYSVTDTPGPFPFDLDVAAKRDYWDCVDDISAHLVGAGRTVLAADLPVKP